MRNVKLNFIITFLFLLLSTSGAIAQERIATFHTYAQDDHSFKADFTFNLDKRTVEIKNEDGPISLSYYDIYNGGDVKLFFSMESGVPAPKNVDQLAKHPFAIFVSLNGIVFIGNNKGRAYEYNMNKEDKHEQIGIILMGLLPHDKATTSSTTKPRSTKTRPNTSVKNNNTAETSSASIASRLYQDKALTPERMLDHPLGFLSTNSSSLTFEDATKQLNACGLNSCSDSQETIFLFPWDDSCNYDLTYKGNPLYITSCGWVNGKMLLYSFEFILEIDYKAQGDKYKRVDVAKEIVSSLHSSKGIIFTDDPKAYHPENTHYFMKGKYGKKEVTILVHDNSTGYVSLEFKVIELSN